MKPGTLLLSLCFLALGGATLASSVIAFDPRPQRFLPPPRPQAAVLRVTPAPIPAPATPAADRDFDVP